MDEITESNLDSVELVRDTNITAFNTGNVFSRSEITIIVKGHIHDVYAQNATVILDGTSREISILGNVVARKVEIKGKVKISRSIFENGMLKLKGHRHSIEVEQDIELSAYYDRDIVTDRSLVITVTKKAKIEAKIIAPHSTVILHGGRVKKLKIFKDIVCHRLIKKGRVDIRGSIYENGHLRMDYMSHGGAWIIDKSSRKYNFSSIETNRTGVIIIKANSRFSGRIYAPYATVILQGGLIDPLVIVGDIFAHKLVKKGMLEVHGRVYIDGKQVFELTDVMK